jgi:hypothetical protein
MRFLYELRGNLVVPFGLLTGQLARSALSFCGLTDTGFGRFFVVAAHLHFTEESFALHLLFQGTERLIDIIVAYDNFNQK